MPQITELEIKKAIKESYSKLATSKASCCAENCCVADKVSFVTIGAKAPEEASSISAGCGSPLELISLKEGDTVVDLGSGGGIDVFRASERVGITGRAIGVDSTPEMIWRSRQTASKYEAKFKNTEFRLGEIEHLPIQSESVDYVISNCVVNLSPDKEQVFKEALRVLKCGGVFAVADITVEGDVPEITRNDISTWCSCLSGALSEEEYRNLLAKSGFEQIRIQRQARSNEQPKVERTNVREFSFFSSHVSARKPT